MKTNFFTWHYTRGFSSLIRLWADILFFVEWKWNIFGLLSTLFSPWKRDVTFRNWIGFHPLRWLEQLISNIFSRIIGAIVRFFVILLGMFLFLLVLLTGPIVFLFWIILPFTFFLSAYFFLEGMFFLSGTLFFFFSVFLFFSALGYGWFLHDFEQLDLSDLRNEKWFPRALARVGIRLKDVPRSAWQSSELFEQFLLERGIKKELYAEACLLESRRFRYFFEQGKFWRRENLAKSVPIGIGWTYAYTPKLDQYSIDLSLGDPTEYRQIHFFGREEEQEMLELVLERGTQANALLVSDPGIGRRTLVHSLARRIRENRARRSLFGTRVLLFELGRLFSESSARGIDPDTAARELLFEAASAGNILLVIENLDTFVGKNGKSSSFKSVLSEMLQYPSLRIIGTMDTLSYRAFSGESAELLKQFEVISLREPSEESTYQALIAKFERLERNRVLFTFAAFRRIIELSKQYEWEKAFPERAIDFAEEVILYWKEHSPNEFILPEDVEKFLSLKTGMPVGAVSDAEREDLLLLEKTLSRRVIGQDEAVRQVAEAFRRSRAGLANPKKPKGSFLFLGPTGVGKTETAKALAEALFHDEEKMVRLDMSEFQSDDSVARLIGSSANGETGRLADLAREHPYGILLLDEIEKAYPRVLDIFLQGLDEGFFTDGAGKKVNLRNMVIIATSNAGSMLIREGISKGMPFEEIRASVLEGITQSGVFRPEFLNRFDGIVFFHPLASQELASIVENRLREFSERLLQEKDVKISFKEGVVEAILSRGYEPEFGARSINRFVEDRVEDMVVKKLLSGDITSGGEIVVRAEDI